MGSIIEQAQSLRAAQMAYDHQAPDYVDEVDGWLETYEGDNWLFESARQLMRGADLRIAGRNVLCCSKLCEAVQDRLVEAMRGDSDLLAAQVIISNLSGRPEKHMAEILMGGEDAIQEIAEELVKPFAELRIQELQQEVVDSQGDDHE